MNLAPEKAALYRAAQVLGGREALATLLGLQDARSVWPYFARRRFLPEYCLVVERATRERGQPVLCEELRPDVAWDVVRNNPLPAHAAGEPITESTEA